MVRYLNPTKIEWTNFTWNPITGCNHGCAYCYARKMAQRLKGRAGYPAQDPFQPTFHVKRLRAPGQLETPSRIFTVSMGDMFGSWVPTRWIERVIDVIRMNQTHTFQVLTKDPQQIMMKMMRTTAPRLPGNLWIGTSISTAKDLPRIYDLRCEGAGVRWVSFEPILGPILKPGSTLWDLDWCVLGAETGNRKGRVEPREEWIRTILEAADQSGVPVFMKDNLEPYWPGDLRRESPVGVEP